MKLNTKQPARVLIVDDMPTAREMLGALLSVEGHNLLYATSGGELLDNLEEFNPDVILLDVMMPGLDGFEVCRQIRADERWQHLPIILITALDSRQDLVDGLDAGADDFLHKPVNGIELRARVRSMLRIKRQFDALEDALQLREDLANMIVHDMRTPLTAIVGFTELLRYGVISVNDKDDIEALFRQVMRLNALVNDILVQIKMEQGRLVLNRQPADIAELARLVEENHLPIAQSRELQLVVELPENPPAVSVDANLYQRMLDNLVANALKYAPPETTVLVRVTFPDEAGCTLRVQVADEGPGILPEDRQRIFNKYEIATLRHRTDTSVGLGLAFCKLVIDAHGGRIFVEDNSPTGSIFTAEI